MSWPFVSRPRIAAVWLCLVVFTAGPASADKFLDAAGGAFVPYSGDVGWSLMMAMGGDVGSPHFRLGGEFDFNTASQDVDLATYGAGTGTVEATLRTYGLNLVGRYVLFPGHFTPYVGMTGGIKIIELDDSTLVAAVGNAAVLPPTNGLGFAAGVGGLLGVEAPVFSHELNVFLEGRADYSWEFTDNLQPVAGPRDQNGVSVLLGLRARF